MKKLSSEPPYPYPKGMQIWACCPEDDETVGKCREWLMEQGYTSDEVKIVRTEENMVLAVMK